MNSQIDFDIMYILKGMQEYYNGLYENEIQNILYLTALLSLYEKKPLADIEYNFIVRDNLPYSSEIDLEIKKLTSVTVLRNNNDKYFLTDIGNKIFASLVKQNIHKQRIRYLEACIDGLITNSLTAFSYNIKNETLINESIKYEKKDFVIDETSLSIKLLYNDFKTLKKVLKNNNDLWLISSLWIKYFNS